MNILEAKFGARMDAEQHTPKYINKPCVVCGDKIEYPRYKLEYRDCCSSQCVKDYYGDK